MRRLAGVVLAVVLCAGCSQLDMGLRSDEPPWGEPYVRGERSSAQRRMERLGAALAAWEREGPPQTGEYLLGPGDVLEVGIFSLGAPGEVTTLRRTVARSGHVTLPYVGNVEAGGLSAQQFEERIKEAYAGTYLRQPQVTVNIVEHRSVPVVVTGAVGSPGLYYLKANRSSVLECLALAGGLDAKASDELLIVRHAEAATPPQPPPASQEPAPSAATDRQTTIPVDLAELIDEGNLVLNFPVRGGDVLIVPSRPKKYIYVLGYVRRPGAYELQEGSETDVLRAVAVGGGLTNTARSGNSFLIRQTPDGQRAIPVNMKKIARGELPPLMLRPGDTVVVGTTLVGKIAELVAPSMGASISATASATP